MTMQRKSGVANNVKDSSSQLGRSWCFECRHFMSTKFGLEAKKKWWWLGYRAGSHVQKPESFSDIHRILVGGLEHLFFHILGIIIPNDFHIFQRGGSTTNQMTSCPRLCQDESEKDLAKRAQTNLKIRLAGQSVRSGLKVFDRYLLVS